MRANASVQPRARVRLVAWNFLGPYLTIRKSEQTSQPPAFRDTPRGLLLEEKAEITKRLGRSPDPRDTFVLAWSEGQRAVMRGLTGPSYRPGGHNDRPDSYLSGRSATERARARHASPRQIIHDRRTDIADQGCDVPRGEAAEKRSGCSLTGAPRCRLYPDRHMYAFVPIAFPN